MDRSIQVCNILSRIVVGGMFRSDYSTKSLRRNMNLISAIPQAVLKRRSPTTEIEAVNIDGLEAEFISTQANHAGILLYLHGGGYFMGSIATHRRSAWEVSHHCNLKVLLINYRLAPEHPYPAALDDAKKAYRFLKNKFPHLPVSVGGDSAGGGLSLALTMALRDEGEPLPARLFAVSPWANLNVEGESIKRNHANDFWLKEKVLKRWASLYFAKNAPHQPYISPALGSFEKFPPFLIFCGDQEILQSDSEQVFDKAKKAGVNVKLHIGKNMQHVWFLAFPFLAESKRAFLALQEFFGSSNE